MRCPHCGTEWLVYLRRINQPEGFKSRKQVARRHWQIKQMREEGMSLAEIGRELDISKPAVHGHVNGSCKCQERFRQLTKGTGRSRQYESSDASRLAPLL